ncbi:MAG: glutamate 5-kinase [Halanaerobiaceae bacterium]
MIIMGRATYNRIVVKVGSSTLTHENGKLDFTRIDHLLRQLVDLKNGGREMLLVTSGAIGAGMGELGLKERPKLIPEQQAAAAVGQGLLVGVYNKFLNQYGEQGAQVLLTASDLEDRERYLNAFNTLLTLLEYGIIPIINENDTVVTEEIKFGDNDTLSALVAGLVEADLLINLSDVEGFYNGDPRENADREVIHRVEAPLSRFKELAGVRGSKFGTGGMKTKLEAAEIAMNSGITMVIGPGYRKNILLQLVEMLAGREEFNLGTTFIPAEESLSKRKQWLSFNLTPAGSIVIDRGAEKALVERGKSLLPGGVTGVEGDFSPGEPVRIKNPDGLIVGKGIVNYSSREVEEIRGCHTGEIYSRLGYINQEEIIHRDNMVIERGV